ncbi:MAG: NADPH:quinone oxidoreductase family protein [Shimia sp.]
MRALQITELGQAPKLQIVERPSPGRGQLLLRHEACGLNFADLLMMKGEYQETPALPFTLGMEVAGTVQALGPNVSGFAEGDRVAVFAGAGGLADYGTFPAPLCVTLPDAMSFTDAAAFQIAYGTSHLALTGRARLSKGQTLLALGAAGGVGLTAVEIGAALGAKVIAVARGADKCAVAAEAGAQMTLDSDTVDLKAELRRLGGVDVVYDPVGGALGETAMKGVRRGGHYLVIGFASGDVPTFAMNHALVKNVTIHGFYWGGYMMFAPAELQSSLRALFEMYGAGTLRPHIGHTAELAQAVEALELLRARKTTGKVVITMDHDAADQSAE